MKAETKQPVTRKNLPIDVLRSFVAILEYGGFTQAGEVLGRSQAAISLQIKKLEGQLDKPLFDRSSQAIRLTAAGETLMEYARQMLALNDRAFAELQERSIEGRVRLGIPSEFATALLPRIVGRFSSENPDVTLEVNCDLSKNLLADLDKDSYDLVLGLHPSPSEAGNNLIKVDNLVWVAGRDDHLEDKILPMIVAPEGCIYRSRATEELKRKHQPWRVVYTIQDLSGIRSAIEEGLGITVLAESTVPKSLSIIRDSERLPKLGKIGVSLLTGVNVPGEACLALRSYIESVLGVSKNALFLR